MSLFITFSKIKLNFKLKPKSFEMKLILFLIFSADAVKFSKFFRNSVPAGWRRQQFHRVPNMTVRHQLTIMVDTLVGGAGFHQTDGNHDKSEPFVLLKTKQKMPKRQQTRLKLFKKYLNN